MYNGALMLLKLKINDNWQVIGGMRTTRLLINRQSTESNNISSYAWKEILGSGLKQININATGIFTGNEAEKQIYKLAFSGDLAEYSLELADKESLQGKFQITHYDRFGDVDEEEGYSICLASSGEIIASRY